MKLNTQKKITVKLSQTVGCLRIDKDVDVLYFNRDTKFHIPKTR